MGKRQDFSRGPIQYINSDFTDTEFGDEGFDVITSLSVIEHGVSLEPMLQEFHRLLTPGGRLLVSTDFWPEKRATADVRTTYGESTQEWTIFDDSELESFVSLTKSVGFTLKGEAKFEDDEPVVEYFDREFTFALLEFVRE